MIISYYYKLDYALNLSYGVSIAGLIQLVFLIIFSAKFYSPSLIIKNKINNNVKFFLRKLLPSIFSSGVTQINILIGTIIASFQSGAVSYLYYADRVYQLNLAIAGIAVGTVSLPVLSKLIKNKKKTLMINIEELSLKGRHNLLNAMAAITVADLLKISKDSIRDSLLTFKGLPHRLENVLTIQGVNYINDSKATNVNAVFYALDSMSSKTVWIVGGVDKGNDYSELLPLVREKVKAIICLGVDNKKIIETFSPIIDLIVETESMEEAVKISRKIAEKKDAVLLSPACASFDLFKDYEDRGNQFKEAIRNL